MLAAGAAGPVDLHLDVLGADLDLHVLGQVGHDLHRGEGGLPPGVGVKGGHPHQAVHPLDHNGGRLDARLVPVLIVHDLIGEAVAFGPAGVHAVEHLGPVLGLGAAGAGVDGENHIGAVVLPGEQSLETGLLHLGLQLGEALLQLGDQGLVLKLVAHLAQGHQVVPVLLALVLAVHLVLEGLDTLLHLLGLLQIVPKAVGGGLRLEHVQLPLGALQVQGLAQLLQNGGQVVQPDFIFVKLKHTFLTLIL